MGCRSKAALRLRLEVCKELRGHLELLPEMGYIQALSSYSVQLKFQPRWAQGEGRGLEGALREGGRGRVVEEHGAGQEGHGGRGCRGNGGEGRGRGGARSGAGPRGMGAGLGARPISTFHSVCFVCFEALTWSAALFRSVSLSFCKMQTSALTCTLSLPDTPFRQTRGSILTRKAESCRLR